MLTASQTQDYNVTNAVRLDCVCAYMQQPHYAATSQTQLRLSAAIVNDNSRNKNGKNMEMSFPQAVSDLLEQNYEVQIILDSLRP